MHPHPTQRQGPRDDALDHICSGCVRQQTACCSPAGSHKHTHTQHICRSRETTLINHIFGGYVRQQTTCCGCGAESRRYYSFMDVVLDIPHGVAELEDALALHTQGECPG